MIVRLIGLSIMLGAVTLRPANAEDAMKGTLVFDVKEFASEIELKPKVETQLRAGGIEWGVSDNQLVITLVNKQFLRAEISNFTRYGEQKTLELAPGEYRLTCVGLVPETAFSVEKFLSKSAFFNLDRLVFPIAAGEATVLEVHPVIRKHSTMLVKFFQPEILVKIVRDGQIASEAVINARTAESIGWDDYSGSLKFAAQ